MVRLIAFAVNSLFGAVDFNFSYQITVGLLSVMFGLTDTEHIDIRSVQKQKFHSFSSILLTAFSTFPSTKISSSAVSLYIG